jgi:hypothetical protein
MPLPRPLLLTPVGGSGLRCCSRVFTTCAEGGKKRREGEKLKKIERQTFKKPLAPRVVLLTSTVHIRTWKG